jgi:hypothetical protein
MDLAGLLVYIKKIDKIARRNIGKYQTNTIVFPDIKSILHFEGKNGPDGIKLMGKPQEPWHFINPAKAGDHILVEIINNHINNLAIALRSKDNVRASFEAAWLAHAIVDGLTPAHHYPLEDKIEELWGKSRSQRSNLIDKNIIRGNNHKDTFLKNWAYWGAGGLITTHILFELGVATAITTNKFTKCSPSDDDIDNLKKVGFEDVFMRSVYKIYDMKMYDSFCKKGWTLKLANDTKKILIPEIINAVTLAWYQAMVLAQEVQ